MKASFKPELTQGQREKIQQAVGQIEQAMRILEDVDVDKHVAQSISCSLSDLQDSLDRLNYLV